jgi:hypothetical protein
MSTYEGEHTIFGLLGQANLTQNDVFLSEYFRKLLPKPRTVSDVGNDKSDTFFLF